MGRIKRKQRPSGEVCEALRHGYDTFALVPYVVVQVGKPRAAQVWTALFILARYGETCPTLAGLARAACMTEVSTMSGLTSLYDAGLIEVTAAGEDEGEGVSRYVLLAPDGSGRALRVPPARPRIGAVELAVRDTDEFASMMHRMLP